MAQGTNKSSLSAYGELVYKKEEGIAGLTCFGGSSSVICLLSKKYLPNPLRSSIF